MYGSFDASRGVIIRCYGKVRTEALDDFDCAFSIFEMEY